MSVGFFQVPTVETISVKEIRVCPVVILTLTKITRYKIARVYQALSNNYETRPLTTGVTFRESRAQK